VVTKDDGWYEPEWTVNGEKLTQAQAMTVRVALQSFAMDMTSPAWKTDEHGRIMSRNYRRIVGEINELIMKEPE
jgi:hypothetical protein